MAPDRGDLPSGITASSSRNDGQQDPEDTSFAQSASQRLGARHYLADRASQPQNFTLRGILVGLAIGVVICFSNMYFGLQTGWVSGMAMPSALIGFAYFKTVSRLLAFPFTPVENVLVQSVAGSVGTMPLGCGFVGVIPALNYLLDPEENGPLKISLWRLVVWSVGICFFGVVFAVPLRKEVIIREKLKFPSGTATALMIRVLHGDEKSKAVITRPGNDGPVEEEEQGLLQGAAQDQDGDDIHPLQTEEADATSQQIGNYSDWKAKIRLLIISFAGSALYVRTPTPIYISLLIPLDYGLLFHSSAP